MLALHVEAHNFAFDSALNRRANNLLLISIVQPPANTPQWQTQNVVAAHVWCSKRFLVDLAHSTVQVKNTYERVEVFEHQTQAVT